MRKQCESDGDHESKLAEGAGAEQELYGSNDQALRDVQEVRVQKENA